MKSILCSSIPVNVTFYSLTAGTELTFIPPRPVGSKLWSAVLKTATTPR